MAIIWPRLVMSELLKSATMYQIDLVKVNEVFSHMVTTVTHCHHSHTWYKWWWHMVIFVIHVQIGHTWSNLSHMVTLVTHGEIGHTWWNWSHMVKLVTHGRIGHILSHWSLEVTVFETLCSSLRIDGGGGGGEGEGKRRLIDLLASPQVISDNWQRKKILEWV